MKLLGSNKKADSKTEKPKSSNPVDRVVKATKIFVESPQEELPPKWKPIERHKEVKRREKQKQAHIPSEVFSSKRPML